MRRRGREAGGGDGKESRDPRMYNQQQDDCVVSFHIRVKYAPPVMIKNNLNVFS